MAEIKEYKDGNTTIKIYDDYLMTDPEEIARILKKIAEIAVNAYKKKEVNAK